MRRALVIALLLLCAAPAHAAGPPSVDARAYIVVDVTHGRVLAQHNANEEVPIASLTKLMTVLVALEHVKLDDVAVVQHKAAAVGESTIDLRAGQHISVHDLLEGALIQSANDAAYALADYAGGGNVKSFVAEMNQKAQELGLRETHYVRPDGLDAPGEYSSAADVTKLARILMRDPVVRSVVRKRTDVLADGFVVHTWNDLLYSLPSVFGVKTGHTDNAGWCEVAAARTPASTVYATILGSPTRAQRNADLAALLRWALARYRVSRVIGTGRTYALVQTGWGKEPLPLVALTPVKKVVRSDAPLTVSVVAQAAVSPPVPAGERLGTVTVRQRSRVVATAPLVSARSVTRPGLAARIGFYARRAVHHVVGWFT